MQKYLTRRLILSLVALLVVNSLSSTINLKAATRLPNIVFILTDDQDTTSLSYMPVVKSLIQDQGITFTNFLTNVSLCCPSRATIMRGQYAHNTGIYTNAGTNGGFDVAYDLGLEKSTISTWLRDEGYQTGLFGKYLNGYPGKAKKAYIPPGWTSWGVSVQGSAYAEFNYMLNLNGNFPIYGDTPEDYGTDVYAQLGAKFIKQSVRNRRPFFLYMSFYAPHSPYTPAPRHADLFPDIQAPRTANFNEEDITDKPQYIQNIPPMKPGQIKNLDKWYRERIQSLQAVDESVLTLINALNETGQLDNTYIIFTSDNGYHLGNHRLIAGKQAAYEEDIHVPMVMRGPGIPQGKSVDYLAGNVDLAPTFAEWAGAQVPDFVDGRSLVPLLGENLPAPNEWRQKFLIEHWPITIADPSADIIIQEPADPDGPNVIFSANGIVPTPVGPQDMSTVLPEYAGLRTRQYKYVEYVTGERELYDLETDPYELTNLLISADRALLNRLAAELALMQQCAAQSCRDAEMQPIMP